MFYETSQHNCKFVIYQAFRHSGHIVLAHIFFINCTQWMMWSISCQLSSPFLDYPGAHFRLGSARNQCQFIISFWPAAHEAGLRALHQPQLWVGGIVAGGSYHQSSDYRWTWDEPRAPKFLKPALLHNWTYDHLIGSKAFLTIMLHWFQYST